MRIATGPASALSDPLAKSLYDFLEDRSERLRLNEAQVFFNFPLYRDEDRVVSCQLLIASRSHGVIVVGTSNASTRPQLDNACTELGGAFSHVFARLFKNPRLKKGIRGLSVGSDAFLFAPNAPDRYSSSDIPLVRSASTAADHIGALVNDNLISEAIFEEVLSTVEGAKGLIRPRERTFTNVKSRAAAIARLEEETNRFDLAQREGYLTEFDGPQRISGLAGSGKTVVLAMKAALTHLKYPEARIAFTFHTKSLYQHVRRLITRFYRQYDDRDPDWSRVNILHAWGGRSNPGVYYNACINAGVSPMTYLEAAEARGKSPFDVVCTKLLQAGTIAPAYDYIFVDEGQDFAASFLQLCLKLAQNHRVVFAYDQLQTIFQPTVPTMQEIFGTDEVELSSDIVLKKCYRNPLEILVSAHAIGFGIYGSKIVQMLENAQHWEALGYEVLSGELEPNKLTRIRRPGANSPSSISAVYSADDILGVSTHPNADDETSRVVADIVSLISREELKPDDILVVAADDRFAKRYLKDISDKLRAKGIKSNNLQIDYYGLQDFVRADHVTLSTVHKAKGNEAYMVFVIGIDALFAPATVRSRNMAFTAMTRAKAWLRVTGIGQAAQLFDAEIAKAKENLPELVFEYPSAEHLVVMKRDLQESDEQRVGRVLAELRQDLSEEEFLRLVQRELNLIGGAKTKATKGPTKGGRKTR